MAISTFSAAPINTAVGNFKAWAKAFSDALKTAGMLTKTANTGQIPDDWATIVALPANDTYAGYEIYQFNDALQATDPVFVKVEYGLANGSTKTSCVQVSVGTGTDGAGTLTGYVSSLFKLGGSSADASSRVCYVSSDGSRLQFCLFVLATNGNGMYFSVARLKDDAGADIAGGVNICSFTGTTAYYQQFLPSAAAPFPTTPLLSPVCAAPVSGNGQYSLNVGVYPIFPFMGYLGNPDLGLVVCFTTDINTVGTTVTLRMYGADHTYMICTGGTSSYSQKSANGNAAPNYIGFLVRYE